MFRFLFKYPLSTFARGHLVLLGGWPLWMFGVLVLGAAAILAWLIRARLPQSPGASRLWRGGLIWLLQTSLVALVLLLLWQPALTLAELKPQQDIIAFVIDNSTSMMRVDHGRSRQAQAVAALQDGVLAAVANRFQTRLYRFDSRLSRIADFKELQGAAPVTHIGESLKQLVDETSDLPIGAIVLLSDGADNSGGIDADTISALRVRHIPVHTVGFGELAPDHDVEVDNAVVAPRAPADTRLTAVVSFHQHGYAGHAGNSRCGMAPRFSPRAT